MQTYVQVFTHMVLLQSEQNMREAKWFIPSKNEGWDSMFPTQSSESWALHLIPLQAGGDTSGE